MATAKPKVKRMMFGGAAKAVAGAVKKAASGAAKGMGSAGKPPATPPAGLNVAGIRKATAGLGDKFPRKAPPPAFPAKSGSGNAAAALRKLPMHPPMPGKAGPRPLQTAPARGISRSDLKMAGMMKKGGAVKKATKK